MCADVPRASAQPSVTSAQAQEISHAGNPRMRRCSGKPSHVAGLARDLKPFDTSAHAQGRPGHKHHSHVGKKYGGAALQDK